MGVINMTAKIMQYKNLISIQTEDVTFMGVGFAAGLIFTIAMYAAMIGI